MTVAAGYSKRRHADELPLRAATVEHLRHRLKNELATDAVFNLPSRYNMVDMLRADLADARSSWLDEALTPKLAQTLARHSDINLTMIRSRIERKANNPTPWRRFPNSPLPSRKRRGRQGPIA